ncbi:helix-turn-helix transcriptional regulator [Ginsengibacter hankyongi]|uniref:Helix-turn-helix transcriptional regulator n=1 Tax=Ginsengibacter hankyongi TaxID=2607284 RepID=A0A5J5IPS5_9BACT|nr:AraC family transcriptional regulator [Ginsengibacter hankyongi]KAA9041532.1 helix-turn-helix transcriptional regulator [Ginsengibacter hankyongi]
MNFDKNYIPLNYSSSPSGLIEWLNGFSRHLKIKPDDNKIEYPENFASGFAKVHNIEPGLTYRIVDYDLNTDFILNRQPVSKFSLIIYFYKYTNVERLFISIDDEIITIEDESTFSAVIMTNSFTSQKVELSKGTKVKGLTLQLSADWLREKIQETDSSNYKLFRKQNVFKDLLNAKEQKLLNEIFAGGSQSFTPLLYTNTRVLRLLEGFLENMLRVNLSDFSKTLTIKDFQSVAKIERILLENYTSDFPKIENLARIALMSETKLKNAFKKAYGMGLFEYYQKNRMHKAKELLNMKKYSVSEVGVMIGYQNLSNFSSAFKKEFGHLPRECNKIG